MSRIETAAVCSACALAVLSPGVSLAQTAGGHAGHDAHAAVGAPAENAAGHAGAGHREARGAGARGGHTSAGHGGGDGGDPEVAALHAMRGPLGLSWLRQGSGTAWQPDTTPMFGWMHVAGGWAVMAHGNAFVGLDAASGPRGGVEVTAPHWAMLMARRWVLGGLLTVRAMASLEALTVGGQGYPLHLQTGESWQGRPLHDRQHPHDLFMELALDYQRAVTRDIAVQLYVAPAGEPALGPVAFPHRMSAFFDPLAPIGHHWHDSTHISFGVVTAGVYTRYFKVEGSWFNGREPDENRYDIELRVPNSYAGRVTFNLARWLSAQMSYGLLRGHDPRHPEVDERRATASVITNVRLGTANWATTFVWGRAVHGGEAPTESLLLESSLNVLGRYVVYGRAEYGTRTGEQLVLPNGHGGPAPLGGHAGHEHGGHEHGHGHGHGHGSHGQALGGQAARDPAAVYEVGSVALGATYVFGTVAGLRPGIGLRGSVAFVGEGLREVYGSSTPVGAMVYLQVRPQEMRMGGAGPGL